MRRRSDDTWLVLLLGAAILIRIGLVMDEHPDLILNLAKTGLVFAAALLLVGLIWRRARADATEPRTASDRPLDRRGVRASVPNPFARVRQDPSRDGGERVLGVLTSGRRRATVRLSIADSRQHLHLLGPTGTGKSTLLLNLAAQDIAAGRGCAVLDPKGDLVRDLLARIPRARAADVVYIGPGDEEHAVGINPLALGPGDDPELVAENALTIFKRIYHDHWGPRTDDILKSCLLTLLRTREPTLGHIPRLLEDSRFRQPIVAAAADPIGLGGFWRSYERMTDAQRSEATGPLQNKLREVLVRRRLRHLLCQPRSTVNFREVIDGGKILLADLGTGRWGESASALAGSFIVAMLWQAALARQGVPEDTRRDFLLYIDEFQTFLGIRGPFADALAQARGLRLSLTVANQHLGQLPRDLQQAVRSNARSRVVFACASDDAASLAREFGPLTAQDLSSLRRFEVAARLLVRGEGTSAFTFRTLAPAKPQGVFAERAEIVAAARQYAAPIRYIDAYLATALGAPSAVEDEGDRREPIGTEVQT